MPDPAILVRRAEPGEGTRLERLFSRAVRALAASAYSPSQLEAWAGLPMAERFEGAIRTTHLVVAECGGALAAFGSLDILLAELDYLYVDPDFAGRGIGREVAETLLGEARRRGLRRLTVVSSINAVGFYERLGFRVGRPDLRHRAGIDIPIVHMDIEL